MIIVKVLTLLCWILALAGFVFDYPSPLDTVAFLTVVFLVVAHIIECVVFAKRVALAQGSKPLHFVQIFIFGYFHANGLPKA